MNDDEDDGTHFFLIFCDSSNIYAYDPVLRTKVRKIASNFTNIKYMAADSEKDYLFIVDYNEEETRSIVYRFYIMTNFTDDSRPFIWLDYTQ